MGNKDNMTWVAFQLKHLTCKNQDNIIPLTNLNTHFLICHCYDGALCHGRGKNIQHLNKLMMGCYFSPNLKCVSEVNVNQPLLKTPVKVPLIQTQKPYKHHEKTGWG